MLSSYLIGACAALYLIALVASSIFSSRLVKREAVKSAENTLNGALSDIEVVLTEVKIPVENMAWVVKEHLDDPDYMFNITRQLVASNEYIIGSALAFEPGYYEEKGKYYAPYSFSEEGSEEINSFQMGNDDYDYFSKEWYMFPVLEGESYWCEPYFDEGGGNQMMTTYSLPILDDAGEVVAVLTSDISLSDLTDRIEAISPFENSYTMLIGHSGALLSYPDKSKLLNETIFGLARAAGQEDLEETAELMVAGESGSRDFVSAEGKRSFIVYGPLLNGWSAGIVCAYRDLFASAQSVGLAMVLAALLGLLLLYIFVRAIIKRKTQPITEFTYTALAIAKGNFSARIPEIGDTDELRHLRQSFLYMEKSINRYISELRTSNIANERYESELNIAKDIQMAMVPHTFPAHDVFDISADLHAAKEVGGDLYDCILKGDKLVFIIGDVSGKGVPAALYMAILKAAFHFIAKSNDDPQAILSTINDIFSEGNDTSMFATIFVGIIDLNTLEMRYCNGGHNPVMLIDPEGHSSFITARPNLAAGLFQGFPYVGESMQLTKGSRIVLYTDGVTEAENKSHDQYGEPRLLEMGASLEVGTSSESFVTSLLDSVRDFAAGYSQSDDITIMSVLLK